MGSDYQVALLLQKQFEQESLFDSDHQLALLVEKDFCRENNVDNPGGNLVYESGTKKKNGSSSKSLTDPSWEVIDPTPDIHTLFVAFNQRFFWTKLLAVSVSWSKRMTSCAGVCTYRGRGGLCQITLSEPLLKLRPRKDLVETLLHEMIHAYLFVTHNNKDRDGHGPEFHKHMYRINAEAGTKITVYHSFHDEVRLYQQHWWRCNGPCQHRKPFFGMVRRAMNRAPGPNDRWWAEHVATCGGKFVKVKEPNKQTSSKKGPQSKTTKPKTKTTQDIRTYIPVEITGVKITKTPIKDDGFAKTIISGVLSKHNSVKMTDFGNMKDAKKNRVLPDVKNTTGRSNTMLENIIDCDDMASSGNYSNTSAKNPSSSGLDPFSVARNHWQNKYSTTNGKQSITSTGGIKRPSEDGSENKSSRMKTETFVGNSANYESVACPICGDEYSLERLNTHIDTCVVSKSEDKECIICLARIASDLYEEHVTRCVDENFKDDLICENAVSTGGETALKTTDRCENSSSGKHTNAIIDLTNTSIETEPCSETKVCPVCDKPVAALDYDKHLEKCLHVMYSNMENSFLSKYADTTTKCLACGNNILKSQLDSHLEECMIDIFKDDFKPSSDINESDKYNCPFCLEVFRETQISSHIEKCIESLESRSGSSDMDGDTILKALFNENEF